MSNCYPCLATNLLPICGDCTLDAANQVFKLNVDRKVLESAPGFDKDNWPDMADSAWGYDIYKHYGYEPYWDRGKSLRM